MAGAAFRDRPEERPLTAMAVAFVATVPGGAPVRRIPGIRKAAPGHEAAYRANGSVLK